MSVQFESQTATLGQADQIEHWWTEIKTNNGDYYMLQFLGNSDLVELRKCNTSWECDQCGLREACKKENADIWTEEVYYGQFSKNRYTIGDVANWLKSKEFSPKYALLSHNCQDLCKAFYRKF